MWFPEYDRTLSQLEAQLTGQLEQEQAGIETQQDFATFMQGKQRELLGEQDEARQGAFDIFQQTLGQNFQDTLGGIRGLTAQMAQDIEAELAQDESRQAAMDTIRTAASGGDISGSAENLQSAAAVRGESVRGLSKLQGQMAALSQEAAAPVAYQMELQRILRPFQNRARAAQTTQQVANTNAAQLQAQAASLGQLTQMQAGPVSALASLYGQNASAYAQVPGGEDVISAQFGDYGYRTPFNLGA